MPTVGFPRERGAVIGAEAIIGESSRRTMRKWLEAMAIIEKLVSRNELNEAVAAVCRT